MGCSSSKVASAPEVSKKEKHPRKKPIPAALKRQVWDMWIGARAGEAQCLCCNSATIRQLEFHCGHIVPESKGGRTWAMNLRPICAKCNLSMGTRDMREFQSAYFPHAPKIILHKTRMDVAPGTDFSGRLVFTS